MGQSRAKHIEENATPPVPEGAAVAAGLPTRAETRAAGDQSGEPQFPLARLRGPEGPAILVDALSGVDFEVPAGSAEAALIAGALDGLEEDATLTRAQLASRVRAFLVHEDTTSREA